MWLSYLIVILTVSRVVLSDHHGDHHTEHDAESLQVDTTSGKVEGIFLTTHNEKTIEGYLGIPFGEPPTGDLRFKAPVPKHRSDSILAAKAFGNSCPQLNVGNLNEHGNRFNVAVKEDEDCLMLNIYTPHPRPEKAPVVVVLHASNGFSLGSSNIDKYDSRQIVEEQGIIVVNLNFRLSELGLLFFDHADAPGNMAVMDQALGLKWVHDNIGNFGGDPEKVTLFGVMNGAITAGLLMMIPAGKDLFEQVILIDQTPINIETIMTKKMALKHSHKLADNVGCASETNDPAKIVACLREKTVEELTNATGKAILSGDKNFRPVIDGRYIAEHPMVLLLQGKIDNHLKVLIGTTKNRGMLANMWFINQKPEEGHFIDKVQFEDLIRKAFPDSHAHLVNAILFHYTDWKHPDCPKAIRRESIDFTSDVYAVCPANRMADELTAAGNDVYLFQFSHHSSKSHYPEWAGVLAGEDLDYILGNVHESNNYTEEEHNFSHTIMGHIGRFIKTGCPTEHEKSSDWPRYNLLHKPYANVRIGGKAENHLRANHCAFWQNAFPRVKLAAAIMTTGQCN